MKTTLPVTIALLLAGSGPAMAQAFLGNPLSGLGRLVATDLPRLGRVADAQDMHASVCVADISEAKSLFRKTEVNGAPRIRAIDQFIPRPDASPVCRHRSR